MDIAMQVGKPIRADGPLSQPKYAVGFKYNSINSPIDHLEIANAQWIGFWRYEILRRGRHWSLRSEDTLEFEMFPTCGVDDAIIAPGHLACGMMIRIGVNVYNARYVEDIDRMVVAVDPYSNAGAKSALRAEMLERAERAANGHHRLLIATGCAMTDEIRMRPYIYGKPKLSLVAS
jgi:hypothetical protein